MRCLNLLRCNAFRNDDYDYDYDYGSDYDYDCDYDYGCDSEYDYDYECFYEYDYECYYECYDESATASSRINLAIVRQVVTSIRPLGCL